MSFLLTSNHCLHRGLCGHRLDIYACADKQQYRQPSAKHLHNKQRLPHWRDRAREDIGHIRHIHHKILHC